MSAPGNVRRAVVTKANWRTPDDIYNPLNDEFRFTLDAAADEDNRKCERWLEGPHVSNEIQKPDGRWVNLCRCGLCADWMEHVVWLNPPYGAHEDACVVPCKKKRCPERGHCIGAFIPGVGDWIKKCWGASRLGATAVTLVPNNTEADWYHRIVIPTADEVRFVKGRISFIDPESGEPVSGNPGGSLIIVWRPRADLRINTPPRISSWDWRA